ncbi:putative transmembrane protein [Toxoplasma gondii TgCatPRC2]|uniref:Putative transmembrane protein n=1 Tax=Toxoplasma gondii TgCatPRC2 TaxID=1130821 RepID=A0A151H7T4_TOXGO|nr:putative transmembrane protein [Toxoplasma gondii TgCatPRC2]
MQKCVYSADEVYNFRFFSTVGAFNLALRYMTVNVMPVPGAFHSPLAERLALECPVDSFEGRLLVIVGHLVSPRLFSFRLRTVSWALSPSKRGQLMTAGRSRATAFPSSRSCAGLGSHVRGSLYLLLRRCVAGFFAFYSRAPGVPVEATLGMPHSPAAPEKCQRFQPPCLTCRLFYLLHALGRHPCANNQ